MEETFSNSSRNDFKERKRDIAAAITAGRAAPPVKQKAAPGAVTRCRYAEDTGTAAFLRLPCRGNRIRCRRLRDFYSFVLNCQPHKCRFYEEAAGE